MRKNEKSISAKFSDDLYQAAIRSFTYHAVKILGELIRKQDRYVFNRERYGERHLLIKALGDAVSYWKDKNLFIYHLIKYYIGKKNTSLEDIFMGLTNVLFLINMDIPVIAAKDGKGEGNLLRVRRVTRILYPLELSGDQCEAKKQDPEHPHRCLGERCGRACFRMSFFPWKDPAIFQDSEPMKSQTLGDKGFDEFFKVAQFALTDCSYNATLSTPFRRIEDPVYIADVLFPALFNEPILFRDMRRLKGEGIREILDITRRWPENIRGERITKYQCRSGFPVMNKELGIVSEAIIPLRIPS